jgi:protein-tyrosine-phosphatase
MAEDAPAREARAVLFACAFNAVRSPMAAALLRRLAGNSLYAASAGVRTDALDPFAVAVMDEIGIDISAHRPKTFEDLEDLEGLSFDLIITLSPEAHHTALALTHRIAAEVEYWPTIDPTVVEGNRAQRLDAYRVVRDELTERIRARFVHPHGGNE